MFLLSSDLEKSTGLLWVNSQVFHLFNSPIQLFETPWTTALQASPPSLSPGVCSNSSPSSQWCHPTISSFVILSSCLKSLPASGSFPRSQFFTSGVQGVGSFSFSISPCNEYSGLISFRTDWFDLLAVQGTLKSLLNSSKASILLSFLYGPTLTSIHDYWKNHS